MSKKMMLLALAVVSAAAFALPAGASASELHLTNVTKFSGTFGAGTLTAAEEPVITCGEAANLNHVTGTVSTGGTTGNIELDFTACHTSVFGFTAACHTEGSAANNTIKTNGVFHFITINEKPGVLVTPEPTVIVCAGISNTKVAGNIIGTITSPACGVASTKMTMKFSSSGAVQEHKSYTGVNYNLTSQTGTGTIKEAGLTSESTTESTSAGTLDCT
jgi:hypothetical protein